MKRRFLSKEHRVSSAGENRTEHPCSLLPPLDPGRRRGRFLMLERVVMTLVTASRLMGGEMKNRNLWVPESVSFMNTTSVCLLVYPPSA